MSRSNPEVERRRERVASLWAKGYTVQEIVRRVGSTKATVSMDIHHLRQTGRNLPRRKSHPVGPEVQDRRARVAALWRKGLTADEITSVTGEPSGTIENDIRWMRIRGEIDPHDPHLHPDRVARREEVARLWREGKRADEIADHLGITRSTLYLDLERLREEGRDLGYRMPNLVGNRSQKGGQRDGRG